MGDGPTAPVAPGPSGSSEDIPVIDASAPKVGGAPKDGETASPPATDGSRPPGSAAPPASPPPSDFRVGFHTSHEIASDWFARGFEGTTLFPRGTLGPLYTGYTGRYGIDYRFMPALRPYLTFGIGNFHTESAGTRDTPPRTIASGMRYNLEAGFLLNEEPAISFGNAGTGFLGGYRRVGLGFMFHDFDADVPTFTQLQVVNRIPFFQGQIPSPIGNFVLGLSLLSSTPGFALSNDQVPGCPAGNPACSTQRVIPVSTLVPLSFDLSLEPNSSPVLRPNYGRLYEGELAPRIVDLTTRQLGGFISMQDVPRYANTRVLLEPAPMGSVDSASSSSLVRVGLDLSFLGLTFSQGRYAADFGNLIRRGNGLEQGLLIGSQGAMNIGLWVMCGTGDAYPSGPDILAGRFGALTDFDSRAACIQAPVGTMALGLGILDGYGATGDPNGSTGTQALFWTTHGAAALIGLIGLVNYVRPFGEDPDTIAFTGGRGVVVPSERIPAIEHRLRDNALLTMPLFWSVFSYLNRRLPLTLDAAPTQGGAMVSGRGRF